MNSRLLLVLLVVVVSLLAVDPTVAAGPCADLGLPGHSEFGQALIASQAQAGLLGAGGHIPGVHHGYSVCNPSGR